MLIEDITAFTGVNEALLNVLTVWHTGENEQDGMCRISSIIGTTSEYYKSNFRDNYKNRVTQFIVIPDDVFGSSENDLCEFVGRYLNAMSLPKDEVDAWANSDGSGDSLPVHDVKQGKGWDVAVTEEGKELNLYPFSRRSIVYLYNNLLQENYRTPRYLLRYVVEKTVRDALWNFDNFPGFKIVNTNINSMETASADTKKQATADYNFKQLILSLKQMIDEVNLAVENSEFRPSENVVSALKSFLGACDKIVQAGAANNATTQYISSESKKLYAVIGQEWVEYYSKATVNILNLLDTVKGIIPDKSRATYAANKIKKAATWNTTIDNYNFLKQGMDEADKILEDLDLDKDSEILAFLRLVSAGKATILSLTDEILDWLNKENLANKIFLKF